MKWFRKAAEQNVAQAQCNLGCLLRQWPRRREGLGGGGEVVSQGGGRRINARLNTNLGVCYAMAKA